MTKKNIPPTDKKPPKTSHNPSKIHEKLDWPLFKTRMEGSFPSIHLNGVSIIQGIALGLLCEQTFRKISEEGLNIFKDLNTDPIKYIYILVTLVCIICVLYEYNWFIGIYRWSHNIIDTSIPIFIGFFEIAAILNISYDHRNWWLYISIFSLFGIVGFINTFMNLKDDMFIVGTGICKDARTNAQLSIGIATIATLLAFIPYMTLQNHCVTEYCNIKTIVCTSENKEVYFLITYSLLIISIICKDCIFINKIHKDLMTNYIESQKKQD